MRKTIALIAIAVPLLSACHKHQPTPDKDATATTSATEQRPNPGKVSIHPFEPVPSDPVEAHRMQEDMIESMILNKQVDLDTLRGEAFRRKVELTPDQIERKKANQPAPTKLPEAGARTTPAAHP